jgi:hypothetical protein
VKRCFYFVRERCGEKPGLKSETLGTRQTTKDLMREEHEVAVFERGYEGTCERNPGGEAGILRGMWIQACCVVWDRRFAQFVAATTLREAGFSFGLIWIGNDGGTATLAAALLKPVCNR